MVTVGGGVCRKDPGVHMPIVSQPIIEPAAHSRPNTRGGTRFGAVVSISPAVSEVPTLGAGRNTARPAIHVNDFAVAKPTS